MIRPRLISVEGNIGAGKSTLISKLQAKYKDSSVIRFLQEPVDIWEKVRQDGKNILELFYEDPKKYSFAFQVLAYSTRLKLIQDEIEDCIKQGGVQVIVMERSLDADRFIFAKMLHSGGMMEDCMYEIYKTMSEMNFQTFCSDKIVWVNSEPTLCLERIKMRGREGEEKIDLKYLEECDRYHKKWLQNEKNVFLCSDQNEQRLESLEIFLMM